MVADTGQSIRAVPSKTPRFKVRARAVLRAARAVPGPSGARAP